MDREAARESRAKSNVLARRGLLFALIAVVGCAVDLATKHWIFARLGMPGDAEPIWLWEPYFGLETSLNEGALFGVGQGNAGLFAVLSIFAAIGILYWLFWVGAASDRLLTIALGCVMAGILGNLYDRLGLPGLKWHQPIRGHEVGDPVFAVRDWLHFKIDAIGFDWPVFNIADSLLVCGAGLLVLHAVLTSPPTHKPPG
jgi:signal peptidase II